MPDLLVPDMSCDGCVQAITRAICAADPSASLVANLETKRVSVQTRLDPAALARAVQGAGFAPEVV